MTTRGDPLTFEGTKRAILLLPFCTIDPTVLKSSTLPYVSLKPNITRNPHFI